MYLCNHVLFGDGKNRIALQNLIYFYALLFTIQYMYCQIFFLVQDRQDRFQGNYQQNRNQNWQDRRNQRQNYSQRERAY